MNEIQKDIIERSEFYFEELLPSYRKVENRVKEESSMKNLFIPTDYMERVQKYKEIKNSIKEVNISTDEIDNICGVELETANNLKKCFDLFTDMLDAKIAVNKCLERKACGDRSIKKEYKTKYIQSEKATKALRIAMVDLDDSYDKLVNL